MVTDEAGRQAILHPGGCVCTVVLGPLGHGLRRGLSPAFSIAFSIAFPVRLPR